MLKLFVDTDVVLDLLAKREPFYESSAELFSLADKGKVHLCVSALSFANLHYILSRQISATKSRKTLIIFKSLITVIPVNDKIISLALSSEFKDFEDGVQYFSAVESGVKIIIARNLKDYKHSVLPVFTPEQYLKQL